MLSKIVNNKKCAPKFVFFNDKKIRKIRIIFDLENSDFGTFWHLSITPIHKVQWFHLTTVVFLSKTFLILYPSLENSTTGIAISPTLMQILHLRSYLDSTSCPFWCILNFFYDSFYVCNYFEIWRQDIICF